MAVLVAFFITVLLVSFICSLLEAIMLSITHTHIILLIQQGRRSGQIYQRLKARIDRPLAAILTLNTVANTVGAAGVGAQALSLYGSKWVAVASGALTFCILVLSEIIPKTLGAVYWKQLSIPAAYLTQILVTGLYPIVVILEAVSKFIASGSEGVKITREEVIASAEISKAGGELFRREEHIIKNLLKLNNVYASDVLTPRHVVFALQKDITVDDVMKQSGPLHFSRIPVVNQGLDDIIGIVYRWELRELFIAGKADTRLEDIVHPLHVIPASKSVSEILEEFIIRKEHLFQVVDEYGGTAGIVTLEDVIETLLGVEIVDELDNVEDMQEYARQLGSKRRSDRGIHE